MMGMIFMYDIGSFFMEELNLFNDLALLITMFISSSVLYIMQSISVNIIVNLKLLYSEWVEFIWTLAPPLVLFSIALPSMKILYTSDDLSDPNLTLKVTGHQWYWSYEYPDYTPFQEIDSSLMLNSPHRLLDLDTHILIPIKTRVRTLITSSDVIHSWTLPSLGVKMDANPGRLNQCMLESHRIGTFYGQCSEICGVNHSFMPICIHVTSTKQFNSWIETK
uniref:Cytochrome c oxidase subunit 2 n=1 Tax=Eomenopon denticulatum TaxID=2965267 RepID=A0A9Y2DXW8_9NEOP|nr:cytochrome c oxidase subunit II [Eomenopon denticulatum]WIM51546.1 cytochrome c oxidase subunit 2 [Eomenopon denticulatum]